MLRPLVHLVRHWGRILRTRRERVAPWSKVAIGGLFVPPFAALVALLRLRALLVGPLVMSGRTDDGDGFRCHLPDLIQMYLVLFGRWEPDLSAFIARRLSAGDLFVDVGANVGYYTLLAARHVGDAGHVVAIDASPELARQLEANVAANGRADQVRVVERAVSDRPGQVEVFAGPAHNVGLATTVPGRGHHREARVEAMPLGDLLEASEVPRVRLVKIDVEGAEPDVLRGMLPMLPRCRDDLEILVELSPKWWSDRALTPEAVLAPFLEEGFHVYEIGNNYWPWRYLWPDDVSPPRRVRRPLPRRVKRLDLVLSRIDGEEL